MEDCVILFLYHNDDEVTNFHLNQFKVQNPYLKIVPINPSSYSKSSLWSYNNMWMHNDTMIYDWMDSQDFVKAKRYCWFDWDTLCEQPVDEYYGDHWDSDFAGTHVYNIQNHSWWQWFEHANKYQNLLKYHNELRGVAPFCGTIVSKDALQISVERLKKENFEWVDQMNELRLSTCANLEGVSLSEIKRNSIQPFASSIGNNGKIFHPIKIKKDANINMNLTEIFNKYQSDKGSIFEAHQYAKDYEELISPNTENLLEIGIGAAFPGQNPLGNCGSIRGWLEWLPNTTIYGFDIRDGEPDLKENSKFKLLIGDQAELKDLNRLKHSIPECDVIIDDGSHVSADQILTFKVLWGKLKIGGLYFIEDIHCRWGEPPHTLEFLQNHPNFLKFFGRDNHGMVFKKS